MLLFLLIPLLLLLSPPPPLCHALHTSSLRLITPSSLQQDIPHALHLPSTASAVTGKVVANAIKFDCPDVVGTTTTGAILWTSFTSMMRLNKPPNAPCLSIGDVAKRAFAVGAAAVVIPSRQCLCSPGSDKYENSNAYLTGLCTMQACLPSMDDISDTVSFATLLPVLHVPFDYAIRMETCFFSNSFSDDTKSNVGCPSYSFSNHSDTVVLQLEWAATSTVDFSLWTSVTSDVDLKSTLSHFMITSLSSRVNFKPYLKVWTADAWGCATSSGLCQDRCIFKYCHPDKAVFVSETITQLCLYAEAQRRNDLLLWWRYVDAFATKCLSVEDVSKCSNDIMSKLPTTPTINLNDCISKSWQPDNTNTLLKQQVDAFRGKELPWATVNGKRVDVVKMDALLVAICDGMGLQNLPKACSCVVDVDPVACLDAGCLDSERFCLTNSKCEARETFNTTCVFDRCVASGQITCPSLGSACVPRNTACPICSSPSSPYWCALTAQCVASKVSCSPPPSSSLVPDNENGSNTPIGGTISAGGFTFLVVAMLTGVLVCTCVVLRQRSRSIEREVRDVMTSYVAMSTNEHAVTFMGRETDVMLA